MNAAPAGGMPASIDAYLGEIASRLPGPRHRRARILAELRDGLEQATADRITAGLPADRAASAATARFGTPAAVADAFAPELTIAYARHTLAWYVATGPLVGIWWLLLLHPTPWHGSLSALVSAIPVIPLVAAGLVAAAATFATTGRLIRWLPEAGDRRAAGAVLAVAALVIAGDVVILGGYLGSQPPVSPLGALAVAASLIRIGISLVVLRRTAALRSFVTRRATAR